MGTCPGLTCFKSSWSWCDNYLIEFIYCSLICDHDCNQIHCRRWKLDSGHLMIAIASWPKSHKNHIQCICNLIGSPWFWTVESANTRNARRSFSLGSRNDTTTIIVTRSISQNMATAVSVADRRGKHKSNHCSSRGHCRSISGQAKPSQFLPFR